MGQLSNRTIAVLSENGFEESELKSPKEFLEQQGWTADIVSIKGGTIKGWKDGNWSNECGWQFRNPSGALVHSEATGGANLTTGVKYTGTADCSNPCPPPVAAFTTTATGLSVLFDAATSVGSIAPPFEAPG